MSAQVQKELVSLKGFTFDGDTGKTLDDLYAAVEKTGYTRDAPFAVPSWREGAERPSVVNSYLDAEGKRAHVIWESDVTGMSRVVDVVMDAPSLLVEKGEGSCGCGCGCGMPDLSENED